MKIKKRGRYNFFAIYEVEAIIFGEKKIDVKFDFLGPTIKRSIVSVK